MSTEALRKQFEDACLANFVERRASGNISDDNGSPATHEALFWRKANGDYGVTLFNAAWWGYKAGHAHRDPIGELLALNSEQCRTIRNLRSTIEAMTLAPAVPQGMRIVPIWLLERVERSLGSFTSDEGWAQTDMDTMDSVSALIATTPAPSSGPAQCVPYPTIDMGHGKWEVGAGKNGGLPCIAFGRNGTGNVGEPITTEPRQMSVEETFAVITFANVAGLDVLQEQMDQVREEFFPGTTPQFSATPASAPAQEVGLTDEERADMACAVAAICTGTSARTVAATAIDWTERALRAKVVA